MSFFNNQFRRRMSMENDDLNPELNEGNEGAIQTVPVDQVAEDILELNEAEGDVVEAEDDVEEAGEALGSLESVHYTVEQTLSNGGMRPETAAMTSVAVDAIVSRLGMPNRVASHESFNGASSRLSATNLTLENIKTTMQSIIDAILRFLANLRAKLKDFFLKIFGAAKSLRKRAEGIEAKARSTAGAPKEPKIELSAALADKLSVKGAIPSDPAGSLKAYVSLADALYKKYSSSADNTASAMADFVGHIDCADDAKFEATAGGDALAKIPLPNVDGFATKRDASSDARFTGMPVKVTSSDELMGGKALFVMNPGDGAGAGTIGDAVKTKFGAFRITIMDADAKRTPIKEKQSVTPLNQAQIISTCETVFAICDQIDAFEKDYAKREAIEKKLDKAGKDLKAKAAKAEGLNSANQAALRQVPNLLKVGQGYISSPTSAMSRELVGASKSVLDYCQLSLANLG